MKKIGGFKNFTIKAIILIFAFCMALPCFSFNVYALNTSPMIYMPNYSSNSVSYPLDRIGETYTFAIKNFEFENEDVVTYYYINKDIGLSTYSKIATINVTTEIIAEAIENEGKYEAEVSFNPFSKNGAGSYNIVATIYRNDRLFYSPREFVFTILQPVDKNLIIKEQKIESAFSQLSKYRLTAKIYLGDVGDDVEIDITGYEIHWFIEGEELVVLGPATEIVWEPPEQGSYIITAVAKYESFEKESNNNLRLNIVKDNTKIIILCLSGIALIATVGVIITTAVKVRKERVW